MLKPDFTVSPARPLTSSSPAPVRHGRLDELELPDIRDDESFAAVTSKLSRYLIDAVETPQTFEQLRTAAFDRHLGNLVVGLANNCHHPALVAALMALKWRFSTADPDDRGINESRGYACEIVAWRFLSYLSQHDVVDQLLYELPSSSPLAEEPDDAENGQAYSDAHEIPHQDMYIDETTHLLARQPIPESRRRKPVRISSHFSVYEVGEPAISAQGEGLASTFEGRNALEIAAVAEAKKFLSQRVAQKIINGIWSGEIIFWESLSSLTKKKALFYSEQ
ncbi:MAG: hypothetical protein M1819_001441 [Sarea resinae]|nr:MAG: hypothetical protein M1819_001441 [Sarea resinae]